MADNDHQTDGLTEVVNVARAAVDQEFQISERLDAKARGQVTIAGQWFAIVQAVSAVAYAAKDVPVTWLYFVAGTALIGGGALVYTFAESAKVWKVKDEAAVHPQGLLDLKGRATTDEAGALDVAVQHYASVLQDRRITNKSRSEALKRAERVWTLAMTVPAVQLVVALSARLFG